MSRDIVRNLLGIGGVLGLLAVPQAQAVPTNLSNNNTIVTVNNDGQEIDVWGVDGIDHLDGGSPIGVINYYVRYGTISAVPLSQLPLVAAPPQPIIVPPFNFNGIDITPTTYTTTREAGFGNATFLIQTKYTVTGLLPTSLGSNIGVLITVTRTDGNTGEALPFEIYEYNDLNLTASAGNDVVSIDGGNPSNAYQTDPLTSFDQVSHHSTSGNPLSVTANPTHYEVDAAGIGNFNLNGNLADTAGPLGPGDEAFAYQFSFVLTGTGPDVSHTIAIQKHIQGQPRVTEVIPEPATTALGLMGLSMLAARTLGRRRKV